MTDLPRTIPLFPLPDAVLFPRMPLPLHVFEPRYRKLVGDALRGDQIIGMALLQEGWEDSYLAHPAIYGLGCAGRIEQSEALPDGRFNLLLRGLLRFRVLREQQGELYRLAEVEPLPDEPADAQALAASRAKLTEALARTAEGSVALIVQDELPDELFVNALCQSLPLEPVERQSLLGYGSASERCGRLLELLDFKALQRAHGVDGQKPAN